MSWRGTQAEARARCLAKHDEAEAGLWDAWVGAMGPEDEEAYRADLGRLVPLRAGMTVLDAGAGTGAVSQVLSRVEGLGLVALEPAPAMLAKLRARLPGVAAVAGFCDAADDRPRFPAARFDLVVSRQVTNGLYDPLAAFLNWHHWLKPGGAVAVIEALFGREAWTGKWAEEVDRLPLSANQSLALVPYLLEAAGFEVTGVELMAATNRRSTTGTRRYLVAARKPQRPPARP